ncbi:hypothetical protein DSO57_1011709 [Entomophthora muscae]|uniref:Uncharacterized protein n=1 Tax=Entomophthora muscae TaxID=34485 RepID=A0ACC2SJB0_9FUNG|nr:hypothetical protein DSO57_1011709 [Entomophthora muscae]
MSTQFSSIEEEVKYWRQESAQWGLRERSLRSQQASLESELQTSADRIKFLQLRLETTQHKHQLLIEKQTESASSNAREADSLHKECLRLRAEIESTKANTLELEQANVRHLENERAALAKLADAQSQAKEAEAICQKLSFELENARRALGDLSLIREENIDLKADLEYYKSSLAKFEEDGSSHEADSSDATLWEREQPKKPIDPSTLKTWVGDNCIYDRLEDLSISKTKPWQAKV